MPNPVYPVFQPNVTFFILIALTSALNIRGNLIMTHSSRLSDNDIGYKSVSFTKDQTLMKPVSCLMIAY
jgi:hypothetical protein